MTLLTRIAPISAFAAALCLAGPASAQAAPEQYHPPRATEYQEVLQLPDWTGIWYPDWSLLFEGRSRAMPVLTPKAQEVSDAYQESIRENGPNQELQAQCLPPGIIGSLGQPYPIEILFSPGRTTIITEAYEQVFRIYTDGRPLPEDPDFFFKGNIVGHWEGDTLVWDAVGLHPLTYITAGLHYTEKSRIHGRIFLQAEDQLVIETTVTDPDVLAEPFTSRIAYRLDNEFPIREWICAENNRLTSDGNGANIDLGFEHLEQEDDPFGPAPE